MFEMHCEGSRLTLAGVCLVLMIFGHAPSALMAAPKLTPSMDVLMGGASEGMWSASLQVGYPWQNMRVQYGLEKGWTPLVEFHSALGVRNAASVGLAKRWVDRRRVRVTGEALFGGLWQTGELAQRGPSGELRIRSGLTAFRVMPYLTLATRHTMLINRTSIEAEEGTSVTYAVGHRWTPSAMFGVATSLGPRFALELGVDVPWIDASQLSIPGIHLSLAFGGGK
ncbi:MAG: hypothetical protein ACKO6N_23995 [Myxococcota bacterium]